MRIIGKVSDDDLQDFYHLSDIFILTSTSEPFGLVYLEAMAVGIPIVTYADLEGAQALFDKDTMMLSPFRDASSLAAAILEAKERRWDAKKIRKRAESWNWRKICDQYVKIYEKPFGPTENRELSSSIKAIKTKE